jgi:hypothetical protein
MEFQDENYDDFNNNEVNNLSSLNYNFVLNDRFVHVVDDKGYYFKCQTPFLKILKPMHTTYNKKKTVAKQYLILEINDELDFNNQIGEFMFIINKIHEVSQEKIREKSVEWFNTEFDDIGLDIKVKRPIDQQKENEFIKICIPKNKDIENEIANLSKGSYVLCNIIFKGLKISSDNIVEEWEIKDLITQEKFDEIQNSQLICDTIENNDSINTLLEDQININEETFNIENNEIVNENTNIENIINNEVINNELISKEVNENTNIEIINEIINIENNEVPKKIKKEKLKSKNIIDNKIKKKELIKKSSKKLIFT